MHFKHFTFFLLKHFVTGTVLILICIFQPAKGQDSLKISTRFTNLSMLSNREVKMLDSDIFLFHQFDPVFKPDGDRLPFDYFYINTGNTGSPVFRLSFNPGSAITFDAGLHQFELYGYSDTSVKFYDTWTPYTRLYYVQGGKEMQILHVTHTRNINSRWNMALEYKTLASTGFYFNQKTKDQGLAFTSRYTSGNSRYKAYFSGIRNYYKSAENGGLASDSLFESYATKDKILAMTRLNKAGQKIIETNVSLFHFYNFIKKDTTGDALKFYPDELSLQHQVVFNRKDYFYSSDLTADTAYYPAIFIDSAATSDFLKVSRLTNIVRINFTRNFGRDSNGFAIKFTPGLIHETGKYLQDTVEGNFNNLGIFLRMTTSLFGYLLHGEMNYNLAGVNNGDYNWLVTGAFSRKKFHLQAGLHQLKKSPDLVMQNMWSNHLKWNNHFSAFSDYHLFFEAGLRWLSFLVNEHLVTNYIYFDDKVQPVQYDGNINYISAELHLKIRLGHFRLVNKFLYQANNHREIMRYPEFVNDNTTFYENSFFKNALKLQVGFDIRFISSYQANSYFAPYSILFAGNSKNLADYITLDPFVNANIKRMNIFVKYENANQGFPRDFNYVLPHYPADPHVLRFGIAWIFFD